MEELTVIGAENGALVVVGDDGTRYRVPITEALHTAIRRNRPAQPAAHRVTPREIQAQIRAGKSAAEVVAATGESLEYVQRFEGPVLAEREYVVTAARSVPVAVAADTESGVAAHTFGGVIDQRLDELGARDVAWSSWKADALWTVRVSFLDGEVERSALWSFDPKKSTLSPANHEAQSLSQQGDGPTTALPRLRAVTTDPADDEAPTGRFDSGAFHLGDTAVASPGPSRVGVRTDPDDAPASTMGQTADLLEALRRRRGERESAPQDDRDAARAAHPSTGSIRVIEVPTEPAAVDTSDTAEAPTLLGMDGDLAQPSSSPASPGSSPASTDTPGRSSAKRGRAAMPSWDEIVFGARPDDDPA